MYALTDVQSMLDRMKNALRITHGRGLDVDAGKAKYGSMLCHTDIAVLIGLAGLKSSSSHMIRGSFLKSVFQDQTWIWFRRMLASRLTCISLVFSFLILVPLAILILVSILLSLMCRRRVWVWTISADLVWLVIMSALPLAFSRQAMKEACFCVLISNLMRRVTLLILPSASVQTCDQGISQREIKEMIWAVLGTSQT